MNITQSVVAERDRALVGGDYAQYHAQAVRRIHTLRKRLGTTTPRGRKFTPKSPVTPENVGQNAEWVQLLLASSERAWAHAMTMKSLQSPENTQKQMLGSTKRQIVSRYRRAIVHAANLVAVLEDQSISRSTTTDMLEAKAYLALLKGGLDFEKSRWQSCIQNYAVARLVYGALATTARSDVYKDILDNTVDPSIRYAAYQLKLPRTKTVQDVSIEGFPSTEKELRAEIENIDAQAFTTSSERSNEQSDGTANLPATISWRTRTAKIEDASVSQALGLAQDKESTLTETFARYRDDQINAKDLANVFDDVIDARQDAVDMAKSAIDELRSQGVDPGDTRYQSLQVIRTAINYAVIEWRVGRNRVLCGVDDGLIFRAEIPKTSLKPRKDGKPRVAKEDSSGRKLARLRERVTLYDSVLQNIDSVKELPGVVADSEFVKELEGKKAYFRALKCLTIGRSHAIEGRVLNSLALYAKASDLARQAETGIKSPSGTSNEPAKLNISTAQIKDLSSHLDALVLQYRGLAELRSVENKSSTQPHQQQHFAPPMIERLHLNKYEDDVDLKNLVNYPPKLQPVPVKPLFFDLAWNYIQYPGRVEKSNGNIAAPQTSSTATAAAPSSQPPQEEKVAKKGWFGFGR